MLAMGSPFFEATRIFNRSPRQAIKFRNQEIGCGGSLCLRRVFSIKRIEVAQKSFRTSFFASNSFTFSTPNRSLDRAFFEFAEEVLDRCIQIDYVEAERAAFLLGTDLRQQRGTARPYLDVLPSAFLDRRSEEIDQFFASFVAFQ